jgi:hypothetical protein
MMTTLIHVFEKAGLGKAPYRYLGCEKSIYQACVGAPIQPASTCNYCGTAIMYKFWLESADGKKFWVGSDCIFKSGDAGLKHAIDADVRKYQKEVRDSRTAALVDTFEAFLKANPTFFADDKRPHPYAFYAAQGKTQGDYNRFCYEHAGPSKRATLARQFLVAAGVQLPAAKRGRSSSAPSVASGTRTHRVSA